MSWWFWLVLSVALYLTTGFLVAGIEAYREGIEDSRTANPKDCTYSDDGLSQLFCWPIFIVAVWIPDMFNFIYKRGRSRATRRLARQGRRAQDKAFKELCKQNGWNYRKVKAAQVRDS